MLKPKSRHYLILAAAIFVVVIVTSLMVSAKPTGSLVRGDASPLDESPKIAAAYVLSGRSTLPDPNMFTHLIYAFAEFNDNCDALVLSNPGKLKAMSGLKKSNPDLKVILGVGGYRKEGFSEMARDKKKIKSFVRSVKAIIDSLSLDGVDLDWEFPTTENGGHTATPEDDRNYVKVVKELRKALGKKKQISFYSYNTGQFIDLRHMAPYVDYVNVSGYNLSVPQEGKRAYHQSPLYPSKKLGEWCVMDVIERHMQLGVPREKILMGIPFFGRGKSPFPSYLESFQFAEYSEGTQLMWDDEAQAPYYADKEGNLLLGFDSPRSLEAKMKFVRANNLPGVFVWNYGGDYYDHKLGHTLESLRK